MALTAEQTPSDDLVAEQIGQVQSPALLAECKLEALDVVDEMLAEMQRLIDAGIRPADRMPPASLVRRAVLATTADLYSTRSAPNGVRGFAGPDGSSVVRIKRDPRDAAAAILAPYVVMGVR